MCILIGWHISSGTWCRGGGWGPTMIYKSTFRLISREKGKHFNFNADNGFLVSGCSGVVYEVCLQEFIIGFYWMFMSHVLIQTNENVLINFIIPHRRICLPVGTNKMIHQPLSWNIVFNYLTEKGLSLRILEFTRIFVWFW